jgi:hypothetical protein
VRYAACYALTAPIFRCSFLRSAIALKTLHIALGFALRKIGGQGAAVQGRKIHRRGACILYFTYLYCILYCICIFWRRPPVTVAAGRKRDGASCLGCTLGTWLCLMSNSIIYHVSCYRFVSQHTARRPTCTHTHTRADHTTAGARCTHQAHRRSDGARAPAAASRPEPDQSAQRARAGGGRAASEHTLSSDRYVVTYNVHHPKSIPVGPRP